MNINKTALHNKIFYFFALLIAFLLPLNKKIIPPLIIVLVLNWLIEGHFKERIRKIRKSPLVVLFASFYLIHIIGLLYSSNLDFGLFDLEIKLSILIFPFLFSTSPSLNKQQVTNVLLAFIAGCLAAMIICLSYAFYRYQSEHDVGFFLYGELSLLHHPTYLSMYLCLSICIMIYYLLEKKTGFSKIHIFSFRFLILLFSVFILFLSAKNGIICLALVLLISVSYLIIQKKKLLQGAAFIVLFTIFFTVIFKLAPDTYKRLYSTMNIFLNEELDKNSKESTSVRLLVWPVTLELIEENFLFGVGTGDIKDSLLKKYEEKGLFGALEIRLNAHNQYLQTFVALGLVGFLILIACLLLPFILGIKKKNYIYILFLTIIAINFLTESILEVQAGVVFYAFFNSLLFFENTD
ncbi:O-antigen ligase family protein [bacterium AH-315-M05]|nr:O-antigen ligase family protein [bacterium AH-315-M05]